MYKILCTLLGALLGIIFAMDVRGDKGVKLTRIIQFVLFVPPSIAIGFYIGGLTDAVMAGLIRGVIHMLQSI